MKKRYREAISTGNRVESSATLFYRSNPTIAPSANHYRYSGAYDARFTLGDRKDVSLSELQAAGAEAGSTLQSVSISQKGLPLDLDAALELAPETRAQLIVLRSLAAQYGLETLSVNVRLLSKPASPAERIARKNALLDLDAASIRFDEGGTSAGSILLLTADGRRIEEWRSFQDAVALGGVARTCLALRGMRTWQ